MEAEREKRAEITLLLQKKESQILLSEGERQEAINFSEGENKKINLALGKLKKLSFWQMPQRLARKWSPMPYQKKPGKKGKRCNCRAVHKRA